MREHRRIRRPSPAQSEQESHSSKSNAPPDIQRAHTASAAPTAEPVTAGAGGHDFARVRVDADHDARESLVPDAGRGLLPGGGVHPAVAHAVDARRGKGVPLEPATRATLEPMMGSSLAGVRLHADEQASHLARSMSARAFTTGSDIFFADSHYRPGTQVGMRLLAHELTHVVQQRGAPASSPSTVADPRGTTELEAQRVADSVGKPTALQSTASPVASFASHVGGGAIHRDPATELAEMAEAGEADAKGKQQKNLEQPPVMRVSNVSDVGAARALSEQIVGWRGNMEEGAKADGAFKVSENRVTPTKMAANETAVSALDDYLVTAGEQSRTLGSFQDSVQKAKINFDRLQAQVIHMSVTGAIDGAAAPGEMAEQLTQSAGLKDTDAAKAKMQNLERNPALLGVHAQVQKAHDDMTTLGQQVGGKQSAASKAVYQYQAALNNFKTGVPSVNDNPDQAKELADLKEKIEKIKKYVSKGLEYAGKAADAAGLKGADKVAEKAGPVVDFLTDEFYDAELNGIKSKIELYNQNHREHAITASLDEVRAASHAFTAAITDFKETVEKFAHAQVTFRDLLQQFGRTADGTKGGSKFAQIAAVLAEVDTYETQLDDALRLGYQEQTAAKEAAAARKSAEGTPKAGGGPRDGVLPYYEPYRFFHNNGGWGYECMKHELHINSLGTSRGSAEGVENIGINATVDKAILDIQEFRKQVDPMRQNLAKAMDLRMDNAMPTGAGSPAPTQRGEKTGL